MKLLLAGAILSALGLVSASMEDLNRDLKTMILAREYAFEDHTVATEDGYILTVFRIPGKLGDLKTKPGPPVLLMHGLIDSADGWVIRDELSPAFLLSEAGYDVWLGNNRGNKYSRRHLTLAPESEAFWNYGIEDLGSFDLPALTDYILSQSTYKKIAYIGHSMGTTQAFYGLATNNEYFKKKWSLFVALAPPLSLRGQQNSPTIKFMTDRSTFDVYAATLRGLKIFEMLPANYLSSQFSKTVCVVIPELCKQVDKIFADNDPELNNDVAIKAYFAHYPSGSSLKEFEQFAQASRVQKFQRYDYGAVYNMQKYGQATPPEIDIQSIRDVPIAIIAGIEDVLAPLEDARWALSQMSHTVVHYAEHKLGHLSFMVAKDMSYFQKDVLDLLKRYHPIVKGGKQFFE